MPKMQLLKKKDANNNVDDLGFTVTQAEIDTWNTVTNHEHNYLPLTAGEEKTITGNLYVKQSSGNGNIIIGNGPVLLGASTGNLAISPKAGGIIYLRPQGSTVSTGALAIKNGLVYPAIDKQVSLGDSSNTFNNIYGTTIYQNGKQVANKDDLNNYSLIGHSHNYSYYQRDVVDLSDTSIYNENTYYPCTSKIPVDGLHKLQVAVQLNSGTKPSWSTHDSGFTYNLSALLKANDWGVTNGTMIILEDVYAHASIKPGALTQLTNSGNAVLWLRGGGKYFVFKDWSDSWTAYTEATDIFSQTISPTETLPTSEDATLIEAISTEWCI